MGTLYSVSRAAIHSLRRNPRFNDFWLRRRETLRFPFYLVSTLARYRGVEPRECPLCGYSGRFRAAGSPPQWDARCPGCGSWERQRLLGLYLRRNPQIGTGSVIHFAPEPGVADVLKSRSAHYRSSDLFQPGCDLQLDLGAIDLPDCSIDLSVCSHVLEHVPDDRKAVSELYRCTAPGGTVLIMVPIIESWARTYENPNVTGPREQERHFGQFDHVRFYGADLRDRIRSAGFDLSEFTAETDDVLRYGLTRGETVFIASRRS
jgi:SAM-dependent methyltransferase